MKFIWDLFVRNKVLFLFTPLVKKVYPSFTTPQNLPRFYMLKYASVILLCTQVGALYFVYYLLIYSRGLPRFSMLKYTAFLSEQAFQLMYWLPDPLYCRLIEPGTDVLISTPTYLPHKLKFKLPLGPCSIFHLSYSDPLDCSSVNTCKKLYSPN